MLQPWNLLIERIGALGPTIDEPRERTVIIPFSFKFDQRISEKALELFKKGFSYREISKRLGPAEATIRQKIQRQLGPSKYAKILEDRKKNYLPKQAPYGYMKVGPELVRHPQEWQIVKTIFELCKEGQKPSKIAKILEERKIRTRKGATWRASIIKSVLTRNQEFFKTD